jgi:lysophospholipid acyltransferase (LPLAT)-like uncharacterized protein
MMNRAGTAWGRLFARYNHSFVTAGQTHVTIREPLPPTPVFFLCWHESILAALAAHATAPHRPGVAISYIPDGFAGSAMKAWLEGMYLAPIPLIELKRLRQTAGEARDWVTKGHDILMAVDGPRGPSRNVKRVSMWLAAKSGAEIRLFGSAATPAIRAPRWDRLVMPLPWARIECVVSAVHHGDANPEDAESFAQTARILNDLNAEAVRRLGRRKPNPAEEVALWK